MKTVLKCPICGSLLTMATLRVEPGTGGAVRCPNCQELLQFSKPYSKFVAILSLLISIGVLALIRVQTLLGFAIGIPLIWIPLSLLMNVASLRIKPPTLQKHKAPPRSFFQWLYDRDTLPDLFDKRRR